MKKNNSIKISIPKPCSQNFGEMPNKEGGLYCGKCENVVYDFSQMTDFELLNFFKSKPDVYCGRFHNSQLNRTMSSQKIKYPLIHKFSKIAASVFAILSLKTQQVKAQGVITKHAVQNSIDGNKKLDLFQDSIIIKGNVKNEKNEMLSNVIVKFEGVATTQTDINGNYEISFNKLNDNHNIYITCPNYVPVVRTYNPVMGSTVFDIVMGHRDSNAVEIGGHTGGVIANYNFENIIFPSLKFKKQSLFCEDEKLILKNIAQQLKSNPDLNITIQAYAKINFNSQEVANKRLKEIIKYLVEKEGILQDRLSCNANVGKDKFDVVEFFSQ